MCGIPAGFFLGASPCRGRSHQGRCAGDQNPLLRLTFSAVRAGWRRHLGPSAERPHTAEQKKRFVKSLISRTFCILRAFALIGSGAGFGTRWDESRIKRPAHGTLKADGRQNFSRILITFSCLFSIRSKASDTRSMGKM